MASNAVPSEDDRRNPGSNAENTAGTSKMSKETVDEVANNDAHKAEKVTKAGRDDIDPNAGSD